MRKSDLQYISETLLISSFLQDCQSHQNGMQKNAGVVQDLGLDSMIGGIVDFAKKSFDVDHPGISIAKLLVPAVLFNINWMLGLLYVGITKVTNFNIESIINGIKSAIMPHIESGQKVPPEVINDAAKAAAAPQIDTEELVPAASSPASDGMFDLIRRNNENYTDMIKIAAGGSIVQKIFGTLFSGMAGKGFLGKIKWLITGLIGWTFKTALLGLGLLGAGAVVAHALGIHKAPEAASQGSPTAQESAATPGQTSSTPTVNPADSKLNRIPTTGNGTDTHKNDTEYDWKIPLVDGSVHNTLLAWIHDIYPVLSRYDDGISSTSVFNAIVSDFEAYNRNEDGNELTVPKDLPNSRLGIVNKIIAPMVKG